MNVRPQLAPLGTVTWPLWETQLFGRQDSSQERKEQSHDHGAKSPTLPRERLPLLEPETRRRQRLGAPSPGEWLLLTSGWDPWSWTWSPPGTVCCGCGSGKGDRWRQTAAGPLLVGRIPSQGKGAGGGGRSVWPREQVTHRRLPGAPRSPSEAPRTQHSGGSEIRLV